MSPRPELQQLALNFLATFFSRHPAEQQPSFSSAWGPLYGLSLPIKPFKDSLYTAIGPFSTSPPPVGGEGVRGWSTQALLLLLLLLLLLVPPVFVRSSSSSSSFLLLISEC